MAGIKIKVDTKEAAQAVKTISNEMKNLGTTTEATERQLHKLQEKLRLRRNLGLPMDAASISKVAQTVGVATNEVNKFSTAAGPAMSGKVRTASTAVVASFSKMRSSWLSFAASVVGSGAIIMHLVRIGAQAMQAEEAFRGMAATVGFNADKMVEAIDRVTNKTIDNSTIMQKALKAVVQGIDPADLEKIGEMSRMVAQKQGITVQQAWERIVDSLSNETPRAMKQMGLLTKEAFNLVNQSFSQGIEDVDMLKMAIVSYNLQVAKMGGVSETASEKLQAFYAQLQDIRESIGTGLIWLLQKLIGAFQAIGSALLFAAEGYHRVSAALESRELGRYGENLDPNSIAGKRKAAVQSRMNYHNIMADSALKSAMELGRQAAGNLYGGGGGPAGPKPDLEKAQAEYDKYINEVKRKLGAKAAERAAAELAKKADEERVYRAKQYYQQLEKSMKYFYDEEEAKIEESADMMRINEENSFKISQTTFNRKMSLLESYYADSKILITEEAKTRSAADREKMSDAEWIAAKEKELDAEVHQQKLKNERSLRVERAKAARDSWNAAVGSAEFYTMQRLRGLEFESEMKTRPKAGILKEQLFAYEWMLSIQKQVIKDIPIGTDAWNSQAAKITETERAIIRLKKAVELLDPYKAFVQGLKDAVDEWGTIGEQMYNIAKETARNMQSAFSDFFFDMMTGELKSLGDYVTGFLNAMARAISNFMANQLTAAMLGNGTAGNSGLLGGLITGAGSIIAGMFGGGYNIGMTASGLAVNLPHTGGIVTETPSFIADPRIFDFAKRYHTGIGPDERAAIIKKDEGVFTQGQMKAMGSASVEPKQIKVEIVNQSGNSLKVSKTNARWDPQETVVTLFIDALERNAWGLRDALGG